MTSKKKNPLLLHVRTGSKKIVPLDHGLNILFRRLHNSLEMCGAQWLSWYSVRLGFVRLLRWLPCNHISVSLSKTLYTLFSTGSTRKTGNRPDWRIVDLDVKHQYKQTVAALVCHFLLILCTSDYFIMTKIHPFKFHAVRDMVFKLMLPFFYCTKNLHRHRYWPSDQTTAPETSTTFVHLINVVT